MHIPPFLSPRFLPGLRVCALAIASVCCSAQACTLWGAAGSASAQGTLLVKNRDWAPDHTQSLRMVKPAGGIAYLGLYADSGRSPGIKAGVNQSGLSVVSASASSLSRAVREQDRERHGVIAAVLSRYHSLDEVAAHASGLFSAARPVFLLLADSSGLMQVEIGQGGRFRIDRTTQGTSTHTNHYRDETLIDAAQRPGQSSTTRLARIDQLLAQGAGSPWKLGDFGVFSHDQHDGPDNSLWRSGHEHTLASWQIALPTDAPAQLHLVIANPGQGSQTRDIVLDEALWRTPAGRIG